MNLRRAITFAFSDRLASGAVQFGMVVVLARLLTPHETGIYSVAAAAISLAHVLREFGIGRYIIQETDLTDTRLSTAALVGFAISLTIAAAIFFARGVFADYYRDPALAGILGILALNFLIIPFSAPTLALLSRDLRFDTLFRISLASSIVLAAVAITLAFAGYSYWALAWASVAGNVTTFLLCLPHTPRRIWLQPGLQICGVSWCSAHIQAVRP